MLVQLTNNGMTMIEIIKERYQELQSKNGNSELTPIEQKAFNALAENSMKADISKQVNTTSDSDSAPNENSNKKAKSVSEQREPNDNKPRAIENDERNKDKKETTQTQDDLEIAGPKMSNNKPTDMMRDAFCYSIWMKKDGKTVSMKFDDMTAPPEIVEIFQKYERY